MKKAIIITAAALAVVLLALPVSPGPARAGAPDRHGTGVVTVPDTIKVLMPDGSVRTMGMDEYLKGVVPREMGADWPAESLKAQAVAARCYAATSNRHPAEGANVCTTTHCQAWSSSHDARTDAAVDLTHKVAAFYGGEIIQSYYFGHCDGHTRNSEDIWGTALPYCRSVPCSCGFTSLWGHGVGMCQEGAKAMAEAGASCEQILTHYYTGVAVVNTAATVTRYFAEGTTREDFATYLCIGNPTTADAQLVVSYLVEGGGNRDVAYTVGANSRRTVDTAVDLGPGKDFSCSVTSVNGVEIIAERPMYFNYRGVWTGGHDTMGASATGKEWYFAEGTTRPGFSTYLCLGNPSGSEATVTITYLVEGGENRQAQYTVGPRTRRTIEAVGDVGEGRDFSCRVESTNGVGIIAERPMYFNYRGAWTGGSNVMGAPNPATNWYFAEGSTRPEFATYLCIGNPTGDAAEVTISYLVEGGINKDVDYVVGANTRRTIEASRDVGQNADFSCTVASTNGAGIVVDRPMYFDYRGEWTGGHDTIGARGPKTTWYFAEGTTRPDFITYLCLGNPEGVDADARITYFGADGQTRIQSVRVPWGSRATVNANDFLGTGDDPAHDVAIKVESTNGVRIIAERPMYFNFRGAWTGGSDVMGF